MTSFRPLAFSGKPANDELRVIKAILFDLGNVIVPFDFKRGYAQLAPRCAYPIGEIPMRIRSTDLVQRFETGQLAPELFVQELCAVLQLNTTYEEFCDIWSSVFIHDTLIPESMLARLAARYRLMLLSNTNPIHFSALRANYPLLRHFHSSVLSYEIGAAKPSAKIFEAAIAQAGCRADECFFADDLIVNVEAARAHGMDAVQFLTAEQIEEELRSRGVEL